MNACHTLLEVVNGLLFFDKRLLYSAKISAKIHLCQQRVSLSLLPYNAMFCLAETKDGFDSRTRYHLQAEPMTAMVLRVFTFFKPKVRIKVRMTPRAPFV